MKKKLLAVLMSTVMVLGLAACGSTPEEAGQSSVAESVEQDAAQGEEEEQITLRMAWWGSQTRHDITTQVIEMYEKEHPNIDIEYEFYSFIAPESATYKIESSGYAYLSCYLYDKYGQYLGYGGSSSINFSIKKALVKGEIYYIEITNYYSSKKEPYSFIVSIADINAPTAPTELSETGKAQSTFTITWKPSEDNIGVNYYIIQRDGKTIKDNLPGNTTSYTDTNLYSGVTYKYVVKAVDLAGNISTASNEIITTMAIDVVSPIAPTNIFIKNTGVLQRQLNWSGATDNGVITEYDIYCNGNMIKTTSNTYYDYTVASMSQADIFKIKAKDSGNNYSEYSLEITSNSSVKVVNLKEQTYGSIANVGVYNFYSFVAPENATYKVELSTNNYLYGYLYDKTGQAIGYIGNKSGISIELAGGEIYYIGFTCNYSYQTGSYRFSASIVDTVNPTAPSQLKEINKMEIYEL